MSAIGAAVILAVVIAAMVHMKAARVIVVMICVLFGLVLGATRIGDGLNAGLALLGRAAAGSGRPDDQHVVPEFVEKAAA